ncbi:MAG: hypothetical protein ACI857_001860 [Arenicella sp.]|jgi:hypothetical protein
MKTKYTYLVLCSLLLLASCGQGNFQRQKFTNFKHLTTESEDVEEASQEIDNNDNFSELADEQLTTNVNFDDYESLEESYDDFSELDDDCGDIMTFNSGAYLKVKVIQVNKEDIVYRKCDDLKGPAYTVLKSSLAELRYINGTKEDLSKRGSKIEEKEDEQVEVVDEKKEIKSILNDKEKPIEPFSIVAFIFSLTYILWIPALVLGIVSLIIQSNNPNQYRKLSKTFAWFSIFFPVGALLLAGLLILLVFFIF